MSNPTAEEILEALNEGKGLTTNYREVIKEAVYIRGEGYVEGEYIIHKNFPINPEELPEDAPEFVKKHSTPYSVEEFLQEEYDFTEVLGLHFEEVERWGGEGEGDSAGIVLKIGVLYFQADWSYVSWDGYYYDGTEFYQVVPKEVMVTKYVRA